MKLKNFLYLTQLEEYDINRIKTWLKNNPDREVAEIKSHLVWTTKIKILNIISKLLFFLPPEQSVFWELTYSNPSILYQKTSLLPWPNSNSSFSTQLSTPSSSLAPGVRLLAKKPCFKFFPPPTPPRQPSPIKTLSSV